MFLGRLKKKLAPQKERETKIMQLHESRSFFFDRTQKMLSETFEDASKLQQQTLTRIDQLSEEIRKLGEIEKEEARKGSAAIKDRFVQQGMNALNKIPRKGKNFEQIRFFLEKTREALDELNNISQKESMHLKFFYREEMKKIADRVKEINKSLDQLDSELSTGFMKKREEVKETIDDLEDMREKKIKLSKEIEEIPENTKSLRKATKNLEKERQGMDFKAYESDKIFVENLENKKEAAQSAIKSTFASINRLLRKQDYNEPNKLLKNYLQNPVDAFIYDKENKILEILKRAQRIDDQQVDNTKELIDNFSNLEGYRDQLIDSINKLEEKKKYIERVYKPKERRAEQIEEQINDYEKRIEEMETKRAHKIMEKRTLEDKIQKKKKELAEKMSNVLDTDIVIR